jgi:hypothetical protein
LVLTAMKGTTGMKHTRQRNSVQLGAVAVAVGLALAGCSSSEPAVQTSSGSTPSVSATPSVEASAEETPDAESVPHDHDAEADPDAETDSTALATRAVTLFCRPSLDYDTWIAELYPVLSQAAAVAYETVDPANVPCTGVTGTAQIRDTDGAYTARVLVPTDAGDYSVYVHRPLDTSPWAVEQITPLASE